jgi:hypothetical protein
MRISDSNTDLTGPSEGGASAEDNCRHDGSPQPYLGYFPDAELVFGIVCPLGTPYDRVVDTLSNYLAHFGYKANPIKLSTFFSDLLIKLV